MVPKELETPPGSGGHTLPNLIQCNNDDTENFVKEDPEEIFGDAAGSSPRVRPSNTPSIRDEHQPSITLSDCPPGTVQMVDYNGTILVEATVKRCQTIVLETIKIKF